MLHRTQDWIEPDANVCVVGVDDETVAIWRDGRISSLASRSTDEPATNFGAPSLEMTTGRDSLEGLAVVDGRWLWTLHRDGQLVTWDLSALDESNSSTALQKVPADSDKSESAEGESSGSEPQQTEESSDESSEETELRLPVVSEFDLGFRICEVDVHREAADVLIAVGGETGRVGLLVGRSGNDGAPPEPTIASSRGHSGDVTALTFGPELQRIASAGQDDRIMVWSTSTEKADRSEAREEPEEAEALDEDEVDEEARVVSAELQLDDEPGGDDDGVAPGDTSGADAPADLPENAQVPEADRKESIDTELAEDRPNKLDDALLDTDIQPPEHTRRLPRLAVLTGSQGWPLALDFSPSGDRLVSGAMDNAVYLWRLTADEPLVGLVSEHHNWVSDVRFSADGSRVVSASWDGTVGIFDGETLAPTYRITAHTDYVTGVDFSAGESGASRLLTVGYDGRVGVWNWEDGEEITSFRAHADWVEGTRWLQGAEEPRFATIASGGVVRIWTLDGGEIASFGGDSAEAFDLGRGIDFRGYVELGSLASDEIGPIQQEEARLGEIRDYQATQQGGNRVKTQTAVSMLESAIEEGPPAAEATGEQESEGPDEATALETFEKKLEESGIETPEVDNPEAKRKAAEVAEGSEAAGQLAAGDRAEPSAPDEASVPTDAPEPDEVEAALDRATSEKMPAVSETSSQEDAEEGSSGTKTPDMSTEREKKVEEELADLGGLEEGESPSIDVDTEDVDISVDADNPLGRDKATETSIEEDLETAGATEEVSHDHPDLDEDLETAGATEGVDLGGPSLDEDLQTAGADEGVSLEGQDLDQDLQHAGTSGVSGSRSQTTPSPGTPQTEAETSDPGVQSDQSEDPGETIVPSQERGDAGGPEAVEDDEPASETDSSGQSFSPSAMPSSESGQTGDEGGSEEDHAFSDRPKSAEELREGLSRLQDRSDAASAQEGVVETSAQDIWTEHHASSGAGAQRTETAPMSAVAGSTPKEASNSSGDLDAWRALKTPLDWVYGVAWRPGTPEVAACGQGGSVHLWSADGEPKQTLLTRGEELNDVAFSTDGRVVVSGGDDGGCHLWLLPEDDDSDIRHARLSGHDSWVNAVATHPNGRWALTGGKDRTARLWNLETGECEAVLEGHSGPVTAVGFTDRHAWTAGRDGLVAQWSTSGDRELQYTGYGEIIELDALGETIGWVTEAGGAYALTEPERVAQLRAHTEAARALSIDPASGRLATGGAGGRIHVYDGEQFESPVQIMGTDSPIWTMDYREGRLAVGVDTGDLRLFR